MQLWQMDIVGGFHLADGTDLKAVTGLDDHSRYCVSVHPVLQAASRPTCEALRAAIKTCGVPEAVLTDNSKVFTARFGPGPGKVMLDRICANNGIRHILTAPYSPTTTGKVERFHKTLRAEFFRLTSTASPLWPRLRPRLTPGPSATTPKGRTKPSGWWRLSSGGKLAAPPVEPASQLDA